MASSPTGLRSAPGWLKLVLAISLGINLVGFGVIAGSWMRNEKPRSIPFTVFGLRPVLRNLPEEDRKIFFAKSREIRPRLKPVIQTMRANRKRFAEILGKEPFDPEALRALFYSQQESRTRATLLTSEALIDALAALSPEARQRFATELLASRRTNAKGARTAPEARRNR